MKLLFVVVLIGCIAATIRAVSRTSEEEAKFMKQINECIKETGASADAWKKIENKEFDYPKAADFLFCVYKKIGYLNGAGDYQIEAIKSEMTEIYGEELANKYMADCTKDKFATGTETALNMAKCHYDTIPESEEER